MGFFILAWVFLAFISTLVGLKVLKVLDVHSMGRRHDEYLGELLIVSAWIGILLISLLLLFLSLFISLSFPLLLLLSAGLFVASRDRLSILYQCFLKIQKSSIVMTTGWFLSLIALASMSTAPIFLYDVGLYHFQLIQWLSKFGTVPGLALLHNRFGFTSSWFALSASFNWGMLSGKIVAIAGGFAVLLAMTHFVLCLHRIALPNSKKEDCIANWFMVVALSACLTYLVRQSLAFSSSPDTPVAILTIEIAWLMMLIASKKNCAESPKTTSQISDLPLVKRGEKPKSTPHTLTEDKIRQKIIRESNVALLPVILAAGAFSIKPSALPLLFIALTFCFFQSFRVNRWLIFKGLIISSLFILPLMIVSLISTGCPLFPSAFLCTELPWSVGAEEARHVSIIIRDWARWIGPTPENANSLNWLVPWLQQSKAAAFLMGASLLSVVSILSTQKKLLLKSQYYVLAVGLVGVAFLLYKAPTLRFGLGSLIVIPSLGIALAFQSSLWLGAILSILFFWFFNAYLSPDQSQWAISFNSLAALATMAAVATFIYLCFWRKNSRTYFLKLFSLLLLVGGVSFSGKINMLHNYKNTHLLLMPPHVLQPVYLEEVKRKEAKNFVYYKAGGIRLRTDQCWAALLPCTPYLTSEDIVLYDIKKGLRGGFRHAP